MAWPKPISPTCSDIASSRPMPSPPSASSPAPGSALSCAAASSPDIAASSTDGVRGEFVAKICANVRGEIVAKICANVRTPSTGSLAAGTFLRSAPSRREARRWALPENYRARGVERLDEAHRRQEHRCERRTGVRPRPLASSRARGVLWLTAARRFDPVAPRGPPLTQALSSGQSQVFTRHLPDALLALTFRHTRDVRAFRSCTWPRVRFAQRPVRAT